MKLGKTILIGRTENGWIIHNYGSQCNPLSDRLPEMFVFQDYNIMLKFLKTHFSIQDDLSKENPVEIEHAN